MGQSGTLAELDPEDVTQNPNNPRRFFNEEKLDLLRTSIQEVGVLVPLIVYRPQPDAESFVLMDGERRWRCALDLALPVMPVNIIEAPTPLENLLRMFNIHNVREDWPLISVALSLREVMELANESGEKRLAEMTGLTRSTVRRSKRLLSLNQTELDLIQSEAHLDRSKQVHREDLYLEIEAAESVLRGAMPEVAEDVGRNDIIRKFVEKAERGKLQAVTDFRYVTRLLKAVDEGIVKREIAATALRELIEDPNLSPKSVFDEIAAFAYKQFTLQRKSELLLEELSSIPAGSDLSDSLISILKDLRKTINSLLRK